MTSPAEKQQRLLTACNRLESAVARLEQESKKIHDREKERIESSQLHLLDLEREKEQLEEKNTTLRKNVEKAITKIDILLGGG